MAAAAAAAENDVNMSASYPHSHHRCQKAALNYTHPCNTVPSTVAVLFYASNMRTLLNILATQIAMEICCGC